MNIRGTKPKEPKLDWKVGLNANTVLTAVLIGTIAGFYSYVDQRIGFLSGASAVVNDELDQFIK